VKIHAAVSLAVVLSILAIGIVASAIRNRREAARKGATALPERVG
jgi:predicted tellurium resistance membrane protein TerC